jgi:hypothetical protein
MTCFPKIARSGHGPSWFVRPLCGLACAALLGFAAASLPAATPPVQPMGALTLPLSELAPGMKGEVWTVFQGTEPEPFEVEVTGVIKNALGPGKSMILCRLTDPRVQNMGAVAGMSGSPLYIDGRLAGALSYQVQRFETVRYAGFTPIDDLLEVQRIALDTSRPAPGGHTLPAATRRPAPVVEPVTVSAEARAAAGGTLIPLTPMFAFGGLSPRVADLFADHFLALGLATSGLGGASTPVESEATAETALRPGQAVAAALAVGDITLAGTGTVSQVEGNRILAFGHPLMGLGTVEVPMATADILTILPSNLSSFKISNTGPVIGTVRQDRLSAIYGEIGPAPEMVPVTVRTPQRTLRFSTVRHPRLTPVVAAAGLAQAVLGSNDAGLNEGFRVAVDATFPGGETLHTSELYAGPQGFKSGLDSFVQKLSIWLQNPVQEVFPSNVTFTVEPLPANPTASLDNVQISRREISTGQTLTVNLFLRDFQSEPLRETVDIPISAAWAGKKLQVIVAPGEVLDELTGRQRRFPVSQIRDFSAYLNALQAERPGDGLYVAVVESTEAFLDQTATTLQLPGSLERIARTADSARFQRRSVQEPLWETHILPGRLVPGLVRRPLVVTD